MEWHDTVYARDAPPATCAWRWVRGCRATTAAGHTAHRARPAPPRAGRLLGEGPQFPRRRAAVSPARAGRTVLPMDHAASAQHTVLRHVYARREHTRLDRGVRVRARGQHSNATGSRAVCTPKATDLERPPIRARVATTCVPTLTHPPIRWSTVTSGCCDEFCRPLVGAINELYLRIEHPDVRWKHGRAALWNRPLIDPLS